MSALLSDTEAAAAAEAVEYLITRAARPGTALAAIDGPGRQVVQILLADRLGYAEAAAGVVQTLIPAPYPEQVQPRFANIAEAMAWFGLFRPFLPAAVGLAYAAGLDELCWRLAVAAEPMLQRTGDLTGWEKAAGTAMAAAERLGEPMALARAALMRGGAHKMRGRTAAAITDYRTAQEHLQAPGDEVLRALAANRQGAAHLNARQLPQAVDCFAQLLAAADSDLARAQALGNLASAHLDAGDYARAAEHGERALELLAGDGALLTAVNIRAELAMCYGRTGRLDAAAELVRVNLGLLDGAPVHHRMSTLMAHGEILLLQGRHGEALEPLNQWLAEHGELGTPTDTADVLDLIARAIAASGQAARAIDIHQVALGTRRAVGIGYNTARTLALLAAAETARGHHDTADRHRNEALGLLAGIDDAAADNLRAALAGARG